MFPETRLPLKSILLGNVASIIGDVTLFATYGLLHHQQLYGIYS
jgi:hypothetical protein